VSNSDRKRLISLIFDSKLTIVDASRIVQISYPNAKAIYKTFKKEGRTAKKEHRFRYKKIDHGRKVERRELMVERDNPYEGHPELGRKMTCGVKRIYRKASYTASVTNTTKDEEISLPQFPAIST